jgi:hypothetical protein
MLPAAPSAEEGRTNRRFFDLQLQPVSADLKMRIVWTGAVLRIGFLSFNKRTGVVFGRQVLLVVDNLRISDSVARPVSVNKPIAS